MVFMGSERSALLRQNLADHRPLFATYRTLQAVVVLWCAYLCLMFMTAMPELKHSAEPAMELAVLEAQTQ